MTDFITATIALAPILIPLTALLALMLCADAWLGRGDDR